MIFGLGGSSQRSSSKSESTSFGIDVSQSALSPEQLAMQQQLMGQFAPALNYGPGALAQGFGFNNQNAMQQSRQLSNQQQRYGINQMRQGNQAANRQFGVASQAQRRAQAGYQRANQSQRQLGQFAQQGNPYLQQQIAGFGADIGRQFREQIMPAIGAEFTGLGQRGSSRQALATGTAAGRAFEEFAQGATNMRSQAYGMQQQAAGQLAGLQTQNAQAMYGLAGQNFGQAAANRYGMSQAAFGQSGLMAGQQADIANQYASTAMMPFQIGAGIVGQPSVLTQGFGMDYSHATASSKGKGSSLNVGFAPT